MDCEKFDRVVLDLLYDELDELTSAAARRHMEHCTRCRSIGSRLRATREVGVLPMIEAPADLEARILQAERDANAVLPLRKRLGRVVSLMASYAMRPQLAMAALLLLMIGSSLLFLRARPGQRESVQVTERGVPEREGQSVAIVPMPAASAAEGVPSHGAPGKTRHRHHVLRHSAPARARAPAPMTAPLDRGDTEHGGNTDKLAENADAGQSAYDRAMAAYRAGRYAEAERRFEDVSKAGGKKAASAALYAALAARSSAGCQAAASRFDEVSSRYSGTSAANEASWQAADCYRSMGDTERARRHYTALLSVAGYSKRARAALDSLDSTSGSGTAVASRHAAAAAKAAPAKAKPAKPAPTSVDEPTP